MKYKQRWGETEHYVRAGANRCLTAVKHWLDGAVHIRDSIWNKVYIQTKV